MTDKNNKPAIPDLEGIDQSMPLSRRRLLQLTSCVTVGLILDGAWILAGSKELDAVSNPDLPVAVELTLDGSWILDGSAELG